MARFICRHCNAENPSESAGASLDGLAARLLRAELEQSRQIMAAIEANLITDFAERFAVVGASGNGDIAKDSLFRVPTLLRLSS